MKINSLALLLPLGVLSGLLSHPAMAFYRKPVTVVTPGQQVSQSQNPFMQAYSKTPVTLHALSAYTVKPMAGCSCPFCAMLRQAAQTQLSAD